MDEALAGIEADASALRGYETVCSAHLLVTSAIAAGLADVGVTSEPAALAYGLGFIPWQEEVCELLVPHKLLGDTEVRALLDVLASGEVSAQLAAIEGYDNGPCGRLVV